ncbi:patatin-like phospholipase family protein [Bermanella marisrubri]|uniref:PNPLA domain-containing protein n=1 Tax=Bermanella marisrubri TaxID=207949 RepID=Q1N331_9GAMM|nr:patatin-like phospholipase family protein [Bermanella marisrubri]EAT12760.1 hypothetical protein RED65_13787 [Oceanobacter sp. RED65] [Bermanella marisrubri]QIZ85124.1 patatin-like phospholipase family protein [Bermanella marisrubri]
MNLELLAGESAFAEIKENGLSADRIRLMVGASGGPKWLMLSRLDQYFTEHFFSPNHSMSLIGSSIGAWRMALYAQKDPLARFKDFEEIYLNQRYKTLSPKEITGFIERVRDALFSGQYARDIVENASRQLHVVAVRNRKLLNGRSNWMQAISLLSAAAGNLVSNKIVEALYPRVVISHKGSIGPYSKTPEVIPLTEKNVAQALVASGAIPMVLEPTLVEGGINRWYWDGGMVDYHFSGPFNIDDGLVFYPHFFPKIVPAWFDKSLPWRSAKAKHYDNVVMVTPSQSFIDQLPYGKIPDRKDFNKLSDDERERYWHTVLDQTNRLVEEFHEMMMTDAGRSAVQPISKIIK